VKKRFWVMLIFFILVIPGLSGNASADIGPKPSVVVDFKGLEAENYYVTLLADTKSTGPWSKSESFRGSGDEKVWGKFNTYPAGNSFFFLGYFADCSDTDTFKWTYYPPATFKILIYFPEYDRFIVSADTYERYAFDSYYTVDATSLDIQSVAVAGEEMSVRRTYNLGWEITSLLCRILATILIELGVAWIFGFRAKKQVRIIAITNIATQTILNILLNIINYKLGLFAFIFNYVWMEFAVFIIEGVVYSRLLDRCEALPGRKVHPWLYSLTANTASFVIGMMIAKLIPGIF